jgi:hypothetical protein
MDAEETAAGRIDNQQEDIRISRTGKTVIIVFLFRIV